MSSNHSVDPRWSLPGSPRDEEQPPVSTPSSLARRDRNEGLDAALVLTSSLGSSLTVKCLERGGERRRRRHELERLCLSPCAASMCEYKVNTRAWASEERKPMVTIARRGSRGTRPHHREFRQLLAKSNDPRCFMRIKHPKDVKFHPGEPG